MSTQRENVNEYFSWLRHLSNAKLCRYSKCFFLHFIQSILAAVHWEIVRWEFASVCSKKTTHFDERFIHSGSFSLIQLNFIDCDEALNIYCQQLLLFEPIVFRQSFRTINVLNRTNFSFLKFQSLIIVQKRNDCWSMFSLPHLTCESHIEHQLRRFLIVFISSIVRIIGIVLMKIRPCRWNLLCNVAGRQRED